MQKIISQILGALVLCVISVCAEQLTIDAKRIYSDEKRGTLTAEGNVHIVKEGDVLDANKVIIYANQEKKPFKMEAIGNVRFVVFTEDKRELKGKCNTLLYFIESKEYHLLGNAQVQEVGKPNFIKGQKIMLSNISGLADIQSDDNAPARVIIDLDDVQESKDSQNKKDSKK